MIVAQMSVEASPGARTKRGHMFVHMCNLRGGKWTANSIKSAVESVQLG